MEPIHTMTALQRSLGKVKEDANRGLVRITEQGGGNYVFCSEAAFDEYVARQREDAAFEARLIDAVGRGMVDIEAGRYTESIDDAFARAAELRTRYA